MMTILLLVPAACHVSSPNTHILDEGDSILVIADDGSKGVAAEEKVHGVALILQVDAQIIL